MNNLIKRNDKIKKFDLQNIELNFSRACNLACSFCPHSLPTYKEQGLTKGFMKKEILNLLLIQLQNKKNIHLYVCGTGEPLLNPDFFELIKLLDEFCYTNDSIFDIISNGIIIQKNYTKYIEFFSNLKKLNSVRISIYDDESYKFYVEKIKDYEFLKIKEMREQYIQKKFLTNRGGILDLDSNKNNLTCFYPFYFSFIDYNGDVTLCAHDWNMNNKIGNIVDTDIITLFNKDNSLRKLFCENKRHLNDYCKNCSVQGTLLGEKAKIDYCENKNVRI